MLKQLFARARSRANEEAEFEKEWNQPRPSQRRTRAKRDGTIHKARQQAILDYLAKHEGEVVFHAEVAKAIGMSQVYTAKLIKELMDKHTIRRIGKVYHYQYYVNHTTVRSKRGTRAPKKATKAPAKVSKPEKKAAPLPVAAPKFSEPERRVLSFLQRNPGPVTQLEIAARIGMQQPNVSKAIIKLEKAKVLFRSLATVEGTKYRVELSDTQPASVSKAAATHGQVGNGVRLQVIIQNMIMKFMVETGKKDVVAFSEWLDQRNK